MAEKLRVGILGAGMAGTAHALAFLRVRGVEVTVLCS
jgi:predicted dehydrogenase